MYREGTLMRRTILLFTVMAAALLVGSGVALARLSRVIAEQDERIASESVEDVPSVDELLVAETFYRGRG